MVTFRAISLGQKIETIEGIVPVRRILLGPCSALFTSTPLFRSLPIFVRGCCELHSQKQAQLKVGAFEPQPSTKINKPASAHNRHNSSARPRFSRRLYRCSNPSKAWVCTSVCSPAARPLCALFFG